jgi:hypothetical protein
MKSGINWFATEQSISNTLEQVQAWVESQGYKGYEPFDGLSAALRPLLCGNLLAERILQQVVRRSIINLRPILGVTKKDSTKGRGYMAWGYLIRYQATGVKACLDKALACLKWLDQHRCPRFQTHSWSNHFDFSSRGGKYSKDDPIIVWTSLIGQAYLEAYEITKDRWCLQIADSVCGWILDLPREKTDHGDCLSYLAFMQSSIHNANMLGAAMLARAYKHTRNSEYLSVARSAMEYSCSRQQPDGSWWYAEHPKYHWIDNFHTGYNLDSLKCYIDCTGDKSYQAQLLKGLKFYKEHFFESSGLPKYYHNQAYPVDSQCAGQAIDTLALFSDQDPECLALACKVAHRKYVRSQTRLFLFPGFAVGLQE